MDNSNNNNENRIFSTRLSALSRMSFSATMLPVARKVSLPSISLRKAMGTRRSNLTTIALSMAVSTASLSLLVPFPWIEAFLLHNLPYCSESVCSLSFFNLGTTVVLQGLSRTCLPFGLPVLCFWTLDLKFFIADLKSRWIERSGGTLSNIQRAQ